MTEIPALEAEDVLEKSEGNRWRIEYVGPRSGRIGAVVDLKRVNGRGEDTKAVGEVRQALRRGTWSLVEEPEPTA